MTAQVRYVLIRKAVELTCFTAKAIERKIEREGREWIKALMGTGTSICAASDAYRTGGQTAKTGKEAATIT
jgi:hypothetical protein